MSSRAAGTVALAVRWDRTVDAIGADAWDVAARGRSLFLSYPWLRSAEGSLTPDPRYLSLSEAPGEAPIACVPMQLISQGASYFYYDLPRMLTDADTVTAQAEHLEPREAARLVTTARQLRERSADLYPALVACANGMAAGLCLRGDLDARHRQDAADAAVSALHCYADEMACPVAGFLYLAADGDPELGESLRASGFARGVIGAESLMRVRWPSFDAYVASFPRNRRTAIRREVSAFERAGLRMEVAGANALGPEIAALQAQLRTKYGHPADEDAILLSYARMRRDLRPYIRVFIARRGTAAVGFVLVFAIDGAYYTKSIGFDYSALGQDFCYFNTLFYEPVRRAIADGVRLIHYGVDSYATKISRGCELGLLHAALRFTGPLRAPLRDAFELTAKARTAHFQRLIGET